MRIGINIDNTLTDIQKDLNDAAYKYATSLNKQIDLKDLNLIDKNKMVKYIKRLLVLHMKHLNIS